MSIIAGWIGFADGHRGFRLFSLHRTARPLGGGEVSYKPKRRNRGYCPHHPIQSAMDPW
jgi:hypothetical protein